MSETMEFDRAGRLQLQLNAARDEIELLRAELDTHTQDTALIERLRTAFRTIKGATDSMAVHMIADEALKESPSGAGKSP